MADNPTYHDNNAQTPQAPRPGASPPYWQWLTTSNSSATTVPGLTMIVNQGTVAPMVYGYAATPTWSWTYTGTFTTDPAAWGPTPAPPTAYPPQPPRPRVRTERLERGTYRDTDVTELEPYLTPDELSEVRVYGRVTLNSLLPGRTYRIPLQSGGMVAVYENDVQIKRLCLQPAGDYLSDTMWMALQVTMLKYKERDYLKQAKSWHREDIHIQGVVRWTQEEQPRFAELRRSRRRSRIGVADATPDAPSTPVEA